MPKLLPLLILILYRWHKYLHHALSLYINGCSHCSVIPIYDIYLEDVHKKFLNRSARACSPTVGDSSALITVPHV